MSTLPYTFDSPDADLILRAPLHPDDPQSSEFKDFHTHKAILSTASTVFHDMFSVPQPPRPANGGTDLPIVHVVESAEIFETFLRLIYPIEPPTINTLQTVGHLLQLASKYMTSGVHARLRQILVSPSFLNSDPIWVYAIACRMDLDEEANLAIPHTYQIDLIKDIPHNVLQAMTAETYNRLLRSQVTHREGLMSVSDEVVGKARALYAYTGSADDPDEISFARGEILDILDKQGKWWQAKGSDGTVGIAPSNYLQLL